MISNSPGARGRVGDIEWLWYHCGDGNHFGTITKPDNLESCYYDQTWSNMCIGLLESYEADGYRLTSLRDFVEALDQLGQRREVPALIEGSCNAGESEGVFCWMGRNDTPWENDSAVLTAVARSRARLIQAETAAGASPFKYGKVRNRLDEAWQSILVSQISDSLGWHAGPHAVRRSFEASEEAFLIANRILDELASGDRPDLKNRGNVDAGYQAADAIRPDPEIFGGNGGGSFTPLGDGVEIFECEIVPVEERCGIRFPFEMSDLVYCPSGLEWTPTRLALAMLKRDRIYLPLANGLVQIGPECYVVKDTTYVHVAACIRVSDRRVEFAIQRGRPETRMRWRFYCVSGSLNKALTLANLVNSVPRLDDSIAAGSNMGTKRVGVLRMLMGWAGLGELSTTRGR